MKRIVLFLISLIVVVVGLTFTVLNADSVTINYYFGKDDVPLSLIVVLAIACGAVIGVIAALSSVLNVKRELSKVRKELKLKEQEVSNLRAIPLKDKH
jgi:putative membrane protein